jgi:hypothetical protein
MVRARLPRSMRPRSTPECFIASGDGDEIVVCLPGGGELAVWDDPSPKQTRNVP